VPGYAVTNLHVRLRQLVDRLEVSAIVNNVFDTTYVDPAGLGGVPGDYPRPGRQGLLRATWAF
jgi:outer membrane receptor protein involved in Fe transport